MWIDMKEGGGGDCGEGEEGNDEGEMSRGSGRPGGGLGQMGRGQWGG